MQFTDMRRVYVLPAVHHLEVKVNRVRREPLGLAFVIGVLRV